MHHTATTLVDRPINQVFRLATDDVAQWSKVVVEDQVIQERNGARRSH